MSTLRKYVAPLLVIAALYAGWGQFAGDRGIPAGSDTGSDQLVSAYHEQRSGVQLVGEGVVVRILPDDNDGSRHQRFILRLDSGRTLLVAHNIDLAPRIPALQKGDTVAFNGVYEWNENGGVIHWTHHDPAGQHQPGWLRHDGRTFQ